MNNATGAAVPRWSAILQALLVTFLWSTSFIIIKWGLSEIPPLTFAGLRYFIATLCFLPLVLRRQYIRELSQLSLTQWRRLLTLGLVFYTFTQGAQFYGLKLLPAVTVSLILNFTPLLVALIGVALLKEIPRSHQWIGALLFIVGVFVYFHPIGFSDNQGLGLLVMGFGVLANAGATILGRGINRHQSISPLVVTFISMGSGSVLLLISGAMLDGYPTISSGNWLALIWMAVINTAVAFT